jgi:uncharacterized repeat protein (TIGR03843 family)
MKDPAASPPQSLSRAELLRLLESGAIEVEGRFLWGSNFTFLVQVSCGELQLAAVYKPVRGETPLWDFPPGTLASREVAAYWVSEALGLGMVPPTVLREEGPAGPGSLQLFVDADPERHYFTFSDQQKERLRPVALFDLVVNNADRKGGHILLGPGEHLWLIDHGLCFHQDYKLRTVVWDFVGQPIPQELLEDLRRALDDLQKGGQLRQHLEALLSPVEIQATIRRARALLEKAVFPEPGPGRPYPWPLV